MVGAGVRAPLMILLGGAGLLLLIACANVAPLLLAPSVVRARETAIRVALGASRWQLALRYFAEGALVSVAGAAAGVSLSMILVRYILAAASAFIPRVDTIAIDWTVLGFSVAVAVATGVLAGLAPLWQGIRMAPNAGLSEGVRPSGAAPGRRRGACRRRSSWPKSPLPSPSSRRRPSSSSTCVISNACRWVSTPTASF